MTNPPTSYTTSWDTTHFVIEAVERVDLGAFKVNHRGTGSAQYHRVRVSYGSDGFGLVH